MTGESSQREMTDAEMDLAIEVEEHNRRVDELSWPYESAAKALGIDLSSATERDYDGRETFDNTALSKAIAALDKDAVEAALKTAQTYGSHARDFLQDILRRQQDLMTIDFRAKVADIDDTEAMETVIVEIEDAMNEVQLDGPDWDQVPWKAAFYVGDKARLAIAVARRDEIAAPRP